MTPPGPRPPAAGSPLRPIAAALCLVLAAVLVPVASTAWWLRTTLTDTATYVETVGPIARDPSVQDALATRLTRQVMVRIDRAELVPRAAEELRKRGVPAEVAESLSLLGEPAREAIRERVAGVSVRVTRSDTFADAWSSANETAHRELVAALEGRSDYVDVTDGATVSIRLATVVTAVQDALTEAGVPGVGRLDPVEASFPIASVEQLQRLQLGYRTLRALSLLLPPLVVGLLLLGVALARDRRRALVRACLGGLAGILLLVVALSVARGLLLGALPADASPAAAEAVYDALIERLRWLLRGVSLALVLIAAGAALTRDPSRGERWRGAVADGARRWRTALAGNRLARWGGIAVAAVAVLAVLALPDPGPAVSVLLVLLAGLGAGVARWSAG